VYEEVGAHSGEATPIHRKKTNDREEITPFIKIINNNERVILQNIKGYLNLQIITFMLHLHLEDRPLYFMRHGESEFNIEDRIGGNPSLTNKGREFSKLLNNFFEKEKKKINCDKFLVNTSTMNRTIETASYLDDESGLFDIKKTVKILDEINAGICDSMTYAEVEETYPEVSYERKRDKMGFRYPNGESYYDVISRVQTYIVELERVKQPIVVIAHKAVLRCLYGYFAVLKIDSLSEIEIPLHTVIKITPQTYGYQEEIFSFNTDTGDIKSYPSLSE
jgi:6-phosphofructo-2-kinase/fructose-2,6-biphosphatase 2